MTTRRADAASAVIGLDLPAEHRYLNVVGACLAAVLEREETLAERDIVTYNVQLAVQEGCTNIVDHAYEGQAPGRIAVKLTLADGPRRLIVDLYDTGQAFDPALAAAPDLDEPQVHGYGLFLMQALMDEVRYERLADRNHWRLTKHLSGQLATGPT